MVAVPVEAPLITPDVEPAIATPVLLLLHVPPDTSPVNVDNEPAHNVVVPEMAEG